jgi:thiamine pyrophosphate-dependent acetolactate synthase large subunit-like protein
MENLYDALRDSGKVHILTKPEQEAMLTAEDYMLLAERCAVLARECAAPRVAEALRTLALNYLTDATCSAADQNVPVRQHASAPASAI